MKAVLTFALSDDCGQDLIEYGLLLGIITVTVLVSIDLIGPIVEGYYAALLALM